MTRQRTHAHTHAHPLIRTASEEADPFAAVQLDVRGPLGPSAVRRSSDAGDCFDKLTYFLLHFSRFTAGKVHCCRADACADVLLC